jgi:hypothetical protein
MTVQDVAPGADAGAGTSASTLPTHAPSRPFNAAALYALGGRGFFSETMMPWWLLAFVVVILLGLGLGGFVTAPAAASAANGTAAVAIISGAAVVIERVLESFWSLVDSRIGAWWPFSVVHDAITNLVNDFSSYVIPYLSRLEFARQAVAKAQTSDDKWRVDVDQILADIEDVPLQLKALSTSLQGAQIGNDQKLAILTESASNSIQAILNTHPALQKELDPKIDLAASLTSDVSSFLATFNDNPPRRLISLLAGCVLGYAVALVLRLDLFSALGVQALGASPIFGWTWGAGVPLTGLIMGLGSSPTHEVIEAIQQYKQSKS